MVRGFRARADPVRLPLFPMIAAVDIDGACVCDLVDQGRVDVLREALG